MMAYHQQLDPEPETDTDTDWLDMSIGDLRQIYIDEAIANGSDSDDD